jgi:hypothetical protein
MWMIGSWLNEYQPESAIKNGAQVIKNVRCFSESADFNHDYVYVGYSKDFFRSDSHNVICVSGSDILLLQTDDIYEVFNKILQIFDFYNSWEMSMIELIDSGASLQELLDVSKDVFQYPLVLTDASHQPLAINFPDDYSNGEFDNYRGIQLNIPLEMLTIMNQELIQNIQERSAYLARTKAFSRPGIIKNLYRKAELIGWFVILDIDDENYERLLQLCDTFSRLIEFWFRANQEDNVLASQSDLFLDILTGKESDRSRIISRLQAVGWLQEDEKFVIQVCVGSENDPAFFTLKKVIPQTFSGCYVIKYMSQLVLIANLRLISEKNMNDLLLDVLLRSQTYCGISYKFTNMLKLHQYFRQAEIAAIYGSKNPGALNYCEEYALDYLKDVIRDNLATDIRHPALKILKHYDSRNNTEYYKTLMEYLLNERDQRKTAKVLCIHRNTLVYRVNRIDEILGLDLNDTSLRNHILMSDFIGDLDNTVIRH